MSKFSNILLRPHDLFIVGPTASGKSSLALELAQEFKSAIVNCDSLQFFKSLKIGTAYPADEDFLKAEHLLFGVADAGQFFSAGEFIRAFENLRLTPARQTQSFLITGGSGFYIKALETGMEDVATLTEEMKHKISFLDDLSDEEKVKRLMEVDPLALNYIHTNDLYRIQRALEIFYSQGLKTSELKTGKTEIESSSFPKLGLYLERHELLARVKIRTEKMLSAGLIDEVKAHLDSGLKDWKPLQSVGYKETQAFISGQMTKAELMDQIVTNTMYLAKRQMTWFRADRKVSWFHSEKELGKAKLWAKDMIRG